MTPDERAKVDAVTRALSTPELRPNMRVAYHARLGRVGNRVGDTPYWIVFFDDNAPYVTIHPEDPGLTII